MRAELVVVRHAPVAVRGVCYGRSDVALRLTHEEALAELDLPPTEVVWTSPAPRCRSLARLVAEHLDRPLSEDPRLWEMDFGAWEGVAWDDIDPVALRSWTESWETAAPPGGETIAVLEERVAAWEAELDATRRHLLIAHAGVVRALWVVREGLDWPVAMQREVPYLSPMEVDRG